MRSDDIALHGACPSTAMDSHAEVAIKRKDGVRRISKLSLLTGPMTSLMAAPSLRVPFTMVPRSADTFVGSCDITEERRAVTLSRVSLAHGVD